MLKVSIVLPCLNEAENLKLLIPEIIKNIPKKYDYEIICIDDGSIDNTEEEITKLAQRNKKIKGIILYKRFGHQQALIAGIEASVGEVIITMDSDFQHPPEMIPTMLALYEKGHDLVVLQKKLNKYSPLYDKFIRKLGYIVWRWVSDGVVLPGVSEFRLMNRKIANYILRSEENSVFLRGSVNLIAKNKIVLPYKVGKRKFGKTAYNFKINTDLFMDGFVSFGTKPLRMATVLGLLIAIVSAVFITLDWVDALLIHRRIVSGYLTIVFLTLILNGFIIFFLGIVGEYIGVIFKEIKKRPKFVIEKKINLK